jgi:hypothetical protein
MKRLKRRLWVKAFWAVFISAFLFSSWAFAAETCYLHAPSGYRRMGGASRLGPYSSRSQCQSVNGQYFHNQGTCSCTSSPSGYSGGANPYQNLFNSLFAPMGEALGKQMECILNPNCEANVRQRQQQQLQQQRLREMQRQQEDSRRQEAERRQKEFEAKKRNLLNQMRGQTGTLEARDLRSLPELKVAETADLFGTKTLKPRDLSSPAPIASLTSRPTTALQRAHCSAYLLRKANEAATGGKFEESAYLSNEAADLMSGAKDSPGVVCPPPPEVPSVEGAPIAEDREKAEKLRKMTFVYSRLYGRVAQQTNDYQIILTTVKEKEEKIEETRLEKEEAKARLEKLQSLKQQKPDEVPEITMTEASAALAQVEAALQQIEGEMAKALAEKADAEGKMNQTRDLFLQVRDHPEKLDDFVIELTVKPSKEG